MKFLYSKSQVYSTKYFLYQYNDNDFRIVKQKFCREKGFEKIIKIVLPTEKEEKERVSLSRTKRNIRALALSNNFEYFATFTVNKDVCNRYDVDICEDNLRQLFKSYKRKNKDFIYLFICEKHIKGGFHFHGLMGGINENDLYINQNNYLSILHFDKLGFNSISKIRDFSKCCNYITKYISKECVRNSHNQIYISSRGLSKGLKTEIQPIENIYNFENDFCSIRDFNINKLSQEEKINFLKNIVDKK